MCYTTVGAIHESPTIINKNANYDHEKEAFPLKYWRGYLVAAILAAIAGGLHWFAAGHRALMDMVYPYVTRLIMTTLADISAGTSICLWQLILFLLIAGVVALVVFTILRRWSITRLVGWCLAAVSLIYLLNTGIYGLNHYAGPIADDIQLDITGYTVNDLEATTKHFLNRANELAQQVNRNSKGDVEFADFKTLAEQAGDGFSYLTYEEGLSVFAGSTAPVKKLGMSWLYSIFGVGGNFTPLTGEAAVNAHVDPIALPFVMCQEMAKRMSIVKDADASFAAYLACRGNASVEFLYSGYFVAYRYCYNALKQVADVSALDHMTCAQLKHDLDNFNDLGIYNEKVTKLSSARVESDSEYGSITDCLVSGYIQEFIVPLQIEEETKFDPMDESQVDLSGLVNAR